MEDVESWAGGCGCGECGVDDDMIGGDRGGGGEGGDVNCIGDRRWRQRVHRS